MSKVQLVIELDADLGAQIGQLILGKMAPNAPNEIGAANIELSKPQPKTEPTPAEKPKKAAKPTPASETAPLTLESVRARLHEIRSKHTTIALAPVFQKYGASKLPEIDPSNYAALLAEVEGMIK